MFSITQWYGHHNCHSIASEAGMISILQFVQKDENFANCKFSNGHCSVRQKNFYIGSNVYTRYEVVAMEWLIQEILNFQCFLPTIYNFLWYTLLPLIVFLGRVQSEFCIEQFIFLSNYYFSQKILNTACIVIY